jgi:hypothetical protein
MSAPIFISHASENSAVAERIVAYLEASGVPCWISSRDISPKEIYAEAIANAMRGAQSCVVIVSKAANASHAVKRELELASRYDKRFIPIRIDATEPGPGLDYYLNNTQWVDYGRERERALDRIVSAYAARTGAAPTAPPAPRPKVRAAPLLIAGALVLIGIGGWFAWRLATPNLATDPEQMTYVEAAAALDGRYHWNSVACGEGPVVTHEADVAIFTMPGAPTYRHQVTGAQRNAEGFAFRITTRVLEPAEARGQVYTFAFDESTGTLNVSPPGQVHFWTRCDGGTTPPAPPADDAPAPAGPPVGEAPGARNVTEPDDLAQLAPTLGLDGRWSDAAGNCSNAMEISVEGRMLYVRRTRGGALESHRIYTINGPVGRSGGRDLWAIYADDLPQILTGPEVPTLMYSASTLQRCR